MQAIRFPPLVVPGVQIVQRALIVPAMPVLLLPVVALAVQEMIVMTAVPVVTAVLAILVVVKVVPLVALAEKPEAIQDVVLGVIRIITNDHP